MDWLGAAIGAISSVAGGIASARGAEAANAEARQSVADQQAWAHRTYITRYQHQMADMKKAGLNPILSYHNPPPGGPATGIYRPENVGAAAVKGAAEGTASAVALSRLRAEVDVMKATSAKLKAETIKTLGEASPSHWSARSAEAGTARSYAEVRRVGAEVEEAYERIKRLEAERDRIKAEIGEIRARTDESRSRTATEGLRRDLLSIVHKIEMETEDAKRKAYKAITDTLGVGEEYGSVWRKIAGGGIDDLRDTVREVLRGLMRAR